MYDLFVNLIVQPIFNVLVAIYALLPGHNFGLAIILFTIIIRLLMWPLVRKQLRNTKAIKQLQPELKRIKLETKGDRQKESMLTMELYKERGVSPFGSIGLLLLQLPILIGLYVGLKKLIDDPNQIVDFAYPLLQNLSWIQELANDIGKFDATLFGLVDLKRAAINGSDVYFPALLIVLASAFTQYYQSKQLMPDDGNTRKLRQILKEAGDGKEADQAEVNAAVGQLTKFLIPVMIFFFTIHIAAALSLYWFVTGLIAIIQQTKVLKEDEVDIAQSLHKDDASNKRGSKTSSSGRKKVQSTARVVSVSSVSKESDKSGGFNKTTATDIKTKTTKRKSTKGGSSKSKKRS